MIYNVEFQSGKRCTVHNAANPIDAMAKAQEYANMPAKVPRPVAMYQIAMDGDNYYYMNGYLHRKVKDKAIHAEAVKEVFVSDSVVIVAH